MDSWIVFAIIAMLLFSVANVLIKVATDNYDLSKAFSKMEFPQNLVIMLVGFAVLALLGFFAFLTAIKTGKLAPVTALLSFGTIMVALITNVLFGVSFSPKEIAAMILAVVSVALFVL